MRSNSIETAPVPSVTHIARLVALGGAVKAKALTDAKAQLPEQFAEQVDFTVHIFGPVTKGIAEPATGGTKPAACDLFGRGMAAEVMRRMGITPAKLRKALRAAAADSGHMTDYGSQPGNAELLTVFNDVSAEVAATLPAQTWSNNGRAATLRSDVRYEIL